MQNFDDLTVREVTIPAGKTITAEELERAELALFSLLHSYKEYQLKEELRLLMNNLGEKYPGTYIILDHDLMSPAELFKILDAADTIGAFLLNRLEKYVQHRADTGDPEAAEDLKSIFEIRG